jgi:hypothetical protein
MTGSRSWLALLRGILALIVVVDLVSFFFFVGGAHDAAVVKGVAFGGLTDLLSHPIARALVVVVGVAGAVGFGLRPGRIWAGATALAALTLLSTVHAQLFGSPWRHLYYSGVCLAGWLLGLAFSRFRGARDDESFARTGAIALLGSAYFNAGLSKFIYGGVEWLSGAPIQAIIVGQDGLVGEGIGHAYRAVVVDTPALASFFSIATVAFELAAPLMLVGGRTRLVVALGLFAMHTNIYLLTPILYWESMVFLLLFGLSPDEPDSQTTADRAMPIRTPLFAGLAALLSVWAVLAVAHQASRYSVRQQALAAASTAWVRADPPTALPTPVAPPTPQPLQRVGPFVLGQTLASVWSVDSLRITDGGFIAGLSGKPGRASFEITCAASEHRSPFDLGTAHIFYSSDLAFAELEEAGVAVRAQVLAAVEGADVCETIAAWRQAAG